MKKALFILFSILVFVVGCVETKVTQRSLRIEILHPQARAVTAANAEDMLKFLRQMDEAMERRGMTSGYTSLLTRSPLKSVPEIRGNVKSLIKRVEEIQELGPENAAYHTGLADVRRTLQQLDLQILGWWTYNTWEGRIFFWIFLWGGLIATIVALLYAVGARSEKYSTDSS